MFSGKLRGNSNFECLIFGQPKGDWSTGQLPRTAHGSQAIGRLQFRDPNNGNKSHFVAMGRHFEATTMVISRTLRHWSSISKQKHVFWHRGNISRQDNGNKSILRPTQRRQIVLWVTKEPDREGPKANQNKLQRGLRIWRPKFARISASSKRLSSVEGLLYGVKANKNEMQCKYNIFSNTKKRSHTRSLLRVRKKVKKANETYRESIQLDNL